MNTLADTQRSRKPEVPEKLTSSSIAKLYAEVEHLLGESNNEIVLDCSEPAKVTSRHIDVLWTIKTKCQEHSVRLLLDNVHPNLIRVLEVLDLVGQFDICTIEQRTELAPVAAVTRISSEKELTFELTASAGAITSAMAELRRHLQHHGITERLVAELEIVFYEVTTNIRLHAGLSKREVMNVSIRINDREAVFVFKDSGKEFDPTLGPDDFVPSEFMEQHLCRGIGITLIRRIADSMDYRRDGDNFNILTLKKNLEPDHE